MTFTRLYIDSNVFIAMLEHSDERAKKLLRLFELGRRDSGFSFMTSELTLAELLVRPIREDDEELVELYHRWIGPDSFVAVRSVDREPLLLAARMRASDPAIKLPDAIHLATALNGDCGRILSFDARMFRSASSVASLKQCSFIEPDGSALDALIAEIAS